MGKYFSAEFKLEATKLLQLCQQVTAHGRRTQYQHSPRNGLTLS